MLNNNKWPNELELLAKIVSEFPFETKIKWGAEVYTYQGKNVLSYGGFKDYFALWFFNGVFLKDEEKVLINAQEGKTKSLRQWRFKSIEDVNIDLLKKYIQEAIDIEIKGLKIAPEASQPLAIPEILANELANSAELNKNFERLSPGRQKDYLAYINEAKQEATKIKRIEKIKPMIMQGIGLNDKYIKS